MTDTDHAAEIKAKADALNTALAAASKAGLTAEVYVSEKETVPPQVEVSVSIARVLIP
jgi:hypothetical protein